MLYHILYQLFGGDETALRVFQYITVRTAGGALTALLITFLLSPVMIRDLKRRQYGQAIRDDGPQSHLSKAGTPTMGGTLILASLLCSTFLWARLDNAYTWIAMLVTGSFGVLGLWDDWMKVSKNNSKGISGKLRLGLELLITAIAALLLFTLTDFANDLQVPFVWNPITDIPLWMYVPFAAIVIAGTANAVNLTDGLDGLALGPAMATTIVFMILAYLAGNIKFAQFLNVVYVPGAGELAVFAGALFGACLAFLWYNTYPAQVFMGDVGSLTIGSALGVLAFLTKQELLMVVVGGIFVFEVISVVLQVGSFKLTGKRIFRMAPFHHSLELKGWAEPKVVVRLWIISIILAIVGLASLKLKFNL